MEKYRLNPAQIIIVSLAAVLLVWFILPGIMNAGTLLGVLLSVIIGLFAVFARQLWRLIRGVWRFAAGKAALCVLAAAIAGFVGFCGFNCVMMANYASQPLQQVNCVMILGCQVRGSEPGYDLLSRMKTALPLIEANPDVPVIVTGGKGRGEDITEAECTKQWLISQGVAEDRIYTEDKSHSTATNFEYSAPLLEEFGISDGIAVVTNDFHQYRANIFAGRLGLSTGHYSAQTRLLVLPNYLIRELAALFFV